MSGHPLVQVIAYDPDTYFAENKAIATKLATVAHSPGANKKSYLRYLELVNNSGGPITLGIGPILSSSKWIAGQWDDAAGGNDFIDDTVDAQDAGANDFALMTTTNNDGFVIAADEPFSTVRISVGTAAAGGAPVYVYEYWNGSAWVTLTLVDTPSYAGVADTHLTFVPPADWAPFATATEGIPAGKYAIRMKASTAPTGTAALATQIFVSHAFKWMETAVADGASATWNPASAVLALNDLSEDLIAYFGTAHAANRVEIIGDDA